jgi:putative redox protein
MEQKPLLTLGLTWQGGFRFTGSAGPHEIVLDGNGEAGPSPMQSLAAGVAGCMAIDVVNILERGRHPLRKLDVRFLGARASSPARLIGVRLEFRITGDVPQEAVERAIQLSREKYCSVWLSLRQDITLDTRYEIEGRTS